MTKKRLSVLLLLIAICLSCFLTCFTSSMGVVYASSIDVAGGYTNVLDDLESDVDFDANNYPVKNNDYSLQVIQIAESNEKELFVYVYQPNMNSGKYIASTINISSALHNKTNVKNYKLTLLNYSGVFQKYLVNGFEIADAKIRYYDIISIYRVFDENIDAKLDDDNENTINEVVFEVGKQYTIQTNDNGKVNISMTETEIETITITSKYVGFVRYEDGFDLNAYDGGCDSHFVAFTTDKPIDRLFEADVYYTTQSYQWIWVTSVGGGQETNYGSKVENYAYLNYQQNASHTTNGIGGHTYSWNRISSVDEFIANEDRNLVYECGIFDVKTETKITDEGLDDLKGKEWVLRFAETNYQYTYTSSMQDIRKTIVGDVSILRLKFETDGIVYDLPVIDNKQSGDGNPDNSITHSLELNDTFKIILAILLLILLVVVLAPILPTIISFIFTIIKVLIKVALWIVSLPFKLFNAIFKKRN